MKRYHFHLIITLAGVCLIPMVASADIGPPNSVPEPSTIVAGALVLVPLGVGLARAFRKPRQ